MGNRSTLCSSTAQCTEKCVLLSGNDADAALVAGRRVCDPTGAVFNETLEELNDIDRQLLLFSSSANLVAVRWLLGLGGNPGTRDMNGTTCLHAACRSGSPSVVETLITASSLEANPLLNVDVAGWTPLHIAAFMGRHEVVTLLLQAGAPLTQRNFAGNTPSDLCSDARTREVINSLGQYVKERKFGPGMAGEEETGIVFGTHIKPSSSLGSSSRTMASSTRDMPMTDQGHQYMRYEPFFVPRAPMIPSSDLPHGRLQQLSDIGKAIFNHQPGRGLAFVVACGCTRDYPIDLVAFLRGGDLDPAQVGHFIGEAFSLSKILRLEFINSVTFTHTGVVSSLTKAFANFKVPPDLRKIDRIVHSLAEVWWRQHERLDGPYPVLHAEGTLSLVYPDPGHDEPPFSAEKAFNGELSGSQLRAALTGPEVLHQLLFSAMLLHWNLHAPLPDSERLTASDWLELNRGIASVAPGSTIRDLPEQVLQPIYEALSRAEDSRLQIPVGNQLPLLGQPSPRPTEGISTLSSYAQVEGWARILGSQVPVPPGLASQGEANAVSCVQMSNMLSEATDTSRRYRDTNSCQVQPVPHQLPQNMAVVNGGALAAVQVASPPRDNPDAAWLCLCKSMLFIATGPGSTAPFAFVHLRSVRLTGLEPGKNLITIDGGSAGFSVAKAFPLQLVFLLPDGRWQNFEIPQLEFEVYDRSQMERWMFVLSEIAKGNAEYAEVTTKRSL